MKRAYIFLIILFLFLTGCSSPGGGGTEKWYDRYRVVAHALGSDGTIPYNCLEGFEWSYGRGLRVFECDLVQTRDGRLVLAHSLSQGEDEEGEEREIPDFEEFMNTPADGGYTPLSLEDMLDIMAEHEDIYLVTDFKAASSEDTLRQISMMTEVIKSRSLTDLYPRIIIQFYDEEELAGIKKLADFGGYIFTLYKRGFDKSPEEFEDIAAFCKKNGVDVIVMKKGKWSSALAPIADKYGIRVYPHTVYTAWQEELMLRSGAYGAYSDGLSEADVSRIDELHSHWYEKTKGFVSAAGVKEAQELYGAGARAIYLEGADVSMASDMCGLLRECPGLYLGYDYDEALVSALSEAMSEEERDPLFAGTVVFTDRQGIFNKGLKKYMLWCDVVYDASSSDESPEKIVDRAEERGIACVVFEGNDIDAGEAEELGKKHDVYVWVKQDN